MQIIHVYVLHCTYCSTDEVDRLVNWAMPSTLVAGVSAVVVPKTEAKNTENVRGKSEG